MSKITNDGLTRSGTGCFNTQMTTVGVKGLTYSRAPMTSLTWGPVGNCTSGRPLNPPLYGKNTGNALNPASFVLLEFNFF